MFGILVQSKLNYPEQSKDVVDIHKRTKGNKETSNRSFKKYEKRRSNISFRIP